MIIERQEGDLAAARRLAYAHGHHQPGEYDLPLAALAVASVAIAAACSSGESALVIDQGETTDPPAATGDDGGPGDSWVAVTVSGGDVTGVNLGLLLFSSYDSAPNATQVAATYALFAEGSGEIVGIPDLTLSGDLSVRVNTAPRTLR